MTRKYRLLYREMGVIPTIMTPFLRYFVSINVLTPVCPTSGTDWFEDAMGVTARTQSGFIKDKPNCVRICGLK